MRESDDHDHQIVKSTWTEMNKAVTLNRASYYTRRKVKGWRVYDGGKAVAKFYRKRDAEAWVKDNEEGGER